MIGKSFSAATLVKYWIDYEIYPASERQMDFKIFALIDNSAFFTTSVAKYSKKVAKGRAERPFYS